MGWGNQAPILEELACSARERWVLRIIRSAESLDFARDLLLGQPSHCILRAVFGVRNTYDLFPEELQENVVTAVRQSLAMKAKQNPSQHFAHLCVNEEAIYNLEARPAQGVFFFSKSQRGLTYLSHSFRGRGVFKNTFRIFRGRPKRPSGKMCKIQGTPVAGQVERGISGTHYSDLALDP